MLCARVNDMSGQQHNQTDLWPSAKERENVRQKKREALLFAAVTMFNEHGFAATSIEDVAASLHVTKPVIYRYLGSKDQVLLECVKRGMAQVQDAIQSARLTPGTGLDRLTLFLRCYAEISTYGFGRCVHRTSEHELSEESRVQFRDLKREIDQAMRQMIEDGVADGSIYAPDVRLTAFALAGSLNWIPRWYNADGTLTAAEVATGIVDTLIVGLKPRVSQ